MAKYKVLFTRVYEIDEADLDLDQEDLDARDPEDRERIIQEECERSARDLFAEEMPYFISCPEDFVSAKVEKMEE